MLLAIRLMSRASEVSKIEVYLNAYRKTWTKSSSLILMMLACHKKSYLICDKITKLRISEILCNIFFKQLSLPCFGSLSSKKNRNRLREYLKIRNFVTFQIDFFMTCQQHEKMSMIWVLKIKFWNF